MKQVFVSEHLVEFERCKDRLEQAGIRWTIKNQRASSLAWTVPFAKVFPENGGSTIRITIGRAN
jgi:hypothetical protein